MKGQGLIEYTLIAVLVAVVVICIVALIDGMVKSKQGDKCALAGDTPACYVQRIRQCVADEQGTTEQCMDRIAAGG